MPWRKMSAPITELDRQIAGHIAEMMPDGACIQLGLGGLPNAIGECLAYAGKKDLGMHHRSGHQLRHGADAPWCGQ